MLVRPPNQLKLALIPHQVEDTLVQQRSSDGYLNATAMCQAVGKRFSHYMENSSTAAYLDELAADVGIPTSQLIQVLKGGSGPQGTWVHPDVAIHLAQWLSPKFAVAVSRWVRDWLATGHKGGGAMPYHLQRYMANQSKVPYTHFSVLSELTLGLIAPLEARGYTLPDKLVPDISQGKMFAAWMRKTINMDTNTLPTYEHEFEDGRIVAAKLYPAEFLDMFRKHFTEVWMPERAVTYFRERDAKALPALEQLLALPAPVRYTLPPADGSAPKKAVVAKRPASKLEAKPAARPPFPPIITTKKD